MSTHYDIFFAGQLVDGFEEATVRANLAALFKANEQTVDKLFSGKAQVIKRGVDKQAALKYKLALQKAGAVALVRAHPEEQPAAEDDDLPSSAAIAASPAPQATQEPESPARKAGETMADRIAALTGEPAPSEDTPGTSVAEGERDAATAIAAASNASAAAPAAASFDAGLSLAPAGSDVLREDERITHEELDIDTSAIHLAAEFTEPVGGESEPPPPAPDTSHLSMGDVGEAIPHLDDSVEPVDPDTSHLSMGEVGETIPHLDIEVELLDPDTSGIDLAPEGSDVLEEKYRKREEAPAPNTDHISLED